MALKIFSAIVAVGLMLAFLAPVVLKLREVSLTVVVLFGLLLMAVDLWQSFRERDE